MCRSGVHQSPWTSVLLKLSFGNALYHYSPSMHVSLTRRRVHWQSWASSDWRGIFYTITLTIRLYSSKTKIVTARAIAGGVPRGTSAEHDFSHWQWVSFSEVAFINYVGFPPCWSRLLVTLFTTTPLQCTSFLPEEDFTDRHSQVLSGERDPGLQAVTTRETADEGSLGTRLMNATSEEIEAYFCKWQNGWRINVLDTWTNVHIHYFVHSINHSCIWFGHIPTVCLSNDSANILSYQ